MDRCFGSGTGDVGGGGGGTGEAESDSTADLLRLADEFVLPVSLLLLILPWLWLLLPS
jgi:hypothetical protein